MRDRQTRSDGSYRRRFARLLRRVPSTTRRYLSHLASALAGFLSTILVAVLAATLFGAAATLLSGCQSGGATDDDRGDALSTCATCSDTGRTPDPDTTVTDSGTRPDSGPETHNPAPDTDSVGDTATPDVADGGDGEPDGSYDGTCNSSAPCDLDCATPGESFTCHGVTFDRVVNIVDEHGADPSGNDPIDGALDSAISDGTLIMFPEGTYKITERHVLSDDTFGFAGAGDVQLVVPQGFNNEVLISSPNTLADRVVFTKIDIDIRAENTASGLKLYTKNGFHVEDVEIIGRGTHSDNPVVSAFSVGVTNPDAVGTLKDCVAEKGSAWARYKGGDGRVGIGVYRPHVGTVRVIDCKMMEFGNNGMYASRHSGNVQVSGGVYRNNNASNIRIHGEGSYLEDALIEVDPDKYTGPREPSFEESAFALRGFVAEQKLDAGSATKAPGVEVRNTDIVYRENPSGAAYPIHAKYTGKTLLVKNTRILDDEDGKPTILRSGQNSGSRQPSSPPRWLKLQNVDITGSASGGAAVQIADADDSVIENTCISQSGDDRDGIRFDDSDGEIADSTVDVTGNPVVRQNSNVATSNLSESGDCEAPAR